MQFGNLLRSGIVIFTCTTLLYTNTSITWGQNETAQTEAPDVEAAASLAACKKAFQDVADYYSKLDAYSVLWNMEASFEQDSMPPEKMNGSCSIVAQSPDKLAIRLIAGEEGPNFVTNGETNWVYVQTMRACIQTETSETLYETLTSPLASLAFPFMTFDQPMLCWILMLTPSEFETSWDSVTSASFKENVEVDGINCRVIRIKTDKEITDIYFAANNAPQIRRVVTDLSPMFAEMAEMMSEMGEVKATMTSRLHEWNTNPEITENTFVFEVPEGAKTIDSFEELFGGFGGAGN